MTTYGPYLRYVRVDEEDGSSIWVGSAMLVVPSNETPSTMTLSSESGSTSIEATKILSALTHDFIRYPLRLPLKDVPQHFSYGFPEVKPGYDFHLPSASDPYWHCSFTSCNGFTGDVSEEAREQMGRERPLWDDMLRRHAQKPYHVMLGGGDQIYCDDVWKLEVLRNWQKVKGKDNRQYAKWTEEMDQLVENFYFTHYCNHFATDGIREAYAKIPQVNVCDDHDCFDGFGSYPEYLEKSNVFQNLRRIGYKYFLLFQLQTTPTEDRTGMFIPKSNSYSMITHLGKSFSALMLDTRHQRTRDRIVTEDEWETVFNAVKELSPDKRHLLVVTGVPLIYPRMGDVEWGLTAVGDVKKVTNKVFNTSTNLLSKGVGKVFGAKAESTVLNAREAVKLKMGKSGLMSAVLNDFGEVSLDDDLIDHWTNKYHDKERASAIAQFQKISEIQQLRVTFIAGDVHCAALGRLFNPLDEADHRLMYQVVSSAIVNAPPPIVVLKKLHSSCAKGNAKPKAFIDGDINTHEEMVELFKTDVDGESKPAAGHKLLGRRNYCNIEAGGDAGDELEFSIMVQNEDWKSDSVPYSVKVPSVGSF